jgi:hypothetical protein
MLHAIVLTATQSMPPWLAAVSAVGFPIVACGALFWYIQNKMDKLADIINANTAVMNKLLERLDKNE